MVNTEIRLIIFFAATDGEALYSQQKQYPVVDVTGDRIKIRCLTLTLECQVHESRQIGSGQTGNGKSEHQHLGISKLKWNGMGEFNSDDHYIYCYGQESLRRNRIALIVNKRV